jgi:hypothetical protein
LTPLTIEAPIVVYQASPLIIAVAGPLVAPSESVAKVAAFPKSIHVDGGAILQSFHSYHHVHS